METAKANVLLNQYAEYSNNINRLKLAQHDLLGELGKAFCLIRTDLFLKFLNTIEDGRYELEVTIPHDHITRHRNDDGAPSEKLIRSGSSYLKAHTELVTMGILARFHWNRSGPLGPLVEPELVMTFSW